MGSKLMPVAKDKKWEVLDNSDTVIENRIAIEVIKCDIQALKSSTNVHNKKTDREFESLHKKIDQIDGRLWWFAGIIIVATVGPLLAGLVG